ncbi:MAG TPA: SprT family zinc-dependent metalloprotease [Ignavibacteriaceae bacterium]|nr:SprT family zinc-dependent metalloprotease [Ignavibacteriaceae bacterium]
MKFTPVKQLRKINLHQKEINYTLIFSDRAKYLRLQIKSNELEVILPRRYKHEKVEDFILHKKGWILKHLKEKLASKYFYFGKEIIVLINYDLFLKKPQIYYLDNKLIAKLPSGFNSLSQDDIYSIWLKHRAKFYIPLRVKELSEKSGLIYKGITIRSQKTRWGSCTAGGKLSFNYKLMRFKKEIIDYVIIHELCHLKEMNHSKKFWNLVENYCPNYKKLKKELRAN